MSKTYKREKGKQKNMLVSIKHKNKEKDEGGCGCSSVVEHLLAQHAVMPWI